MSSIDLEMMEWGYQGVRRQCLECFGALKDGLCRKALKSMPSCVVLLSFVGIVEVPMPRRTGSHTEGLLPCWTVLTT